MDRKPDDPGAGDVVAFIGRALQLTLEEAEEVAGVEALCVLNRSQGLIQRFT